MIISFVCLFKYKLTNLLKYLKFNLFSPPSETFSQLNWRKIKEYTSNKSFSGTHVQAKTNNSGSDLNHALSPLDLANLRYLC